MPASPPPRLRCTSIGCVAMQEVEPGSQWPHTAHLFISSCIQYGINTSSSGKASTLFNPPLPLQNPSLPLFLLFALISFVSTSLSVQSPALLPPPSRSHTFFISACAFNQAWKHLGYTVLLQIRQTNPYSPPLLIMYWADFICLYN